MPGHISPDCAVRIIPLAWQAGAPTGINPTMSITPPPLGAAPAILFVTATRIGDAVLSTGLLRHLVERYPGARFTVAAGPVSAPLFQGLPGLERLVVLRKRSYARHWLDLYRQVAFRRWDLV